MSHDDTYGLLAEVVRRRRKALSLSQTELGDLAGCGRLFVHRLETAKSSLRMDKLLAVLNVLGLQFELTNGNNLLVDRSDAPH